MAGARCALATLLIARVPLAKLWAPAGRTGVPWNIHVKLLPDRGHWKQTCCPIMRARWLSELISRHWAWTEDRQTDTHSVTRQWLQQYNMPHTSCNLQLLIRVLGTSQYLIYACILIYRKRYRDTISTNTLGHVHTVLWYIGPLRLKQDYSTWWSSSLCTVAHVTRETAVAEGLDLRPLSFWQGITISVVLWRVPIAVVCTLSTVRCLNKLEDQLISPSYL